MSNSKQAEFSERCFQVIAAVFAVVALVAAVSATRYWVSEDTFKYLELGTRSLGALVVVVCAGILLMSLRHRTSRGHQMFGAEDSFTARVFKRAAFISWFTTFVGLTQLDKLVSVAPQMDAVTYLTDLLLAVMLGVFTLSFLVLYHRGSVD